MSTLKIKPKKDKTDLNQVNGNPEFVQDMLMASMRNHASLVEAAIPTQGLWMGEIFDENDIVYGIFPDMAKPTNTGMVRLSGGQDHLLAMAGVPGRLLTAFAVNDLEEATMFAEIASLRAREIKAEGSMSDITRMFWEKMTPGGRVLNGRKTVTEWREIASELNEAAKLMEQDALNFPNWNQTAG